MCAFALRINLNAVPILFCQVLAKAIGGGLQCEGYHRRRKVAKALAANKLLQQLQGKPSRKVRIHVYMLLA